MQAKENKLSRGDIRCIKALMSSNVTLLRVYPYESHTMNLIADTKGYTDKVTIKKNSPLYKRLTDIRSYAEHYNLNENKIVIQVEINVSSHNGVLFLDELLLKH